MVTLTFSESDEDLVNPERGFYVGVDLLTGDPAVVRADGHSLAIAVVRLDDYRDRALDSALLQDLDDAFGRVRGAGIKVILRFAYNASFAADAPRDRILGHIAQLAPILQDNADVISALQAGFIGAWGEWHTSTNGLDNDEDRAAILNALLAALPASRAVQVRTPMFKAAAFPGGALAEDEAFSGSSRARVGHHNDCFLASPDDQGTFAAPVATWEAYVAQDGQYTPIGGETCALYPARTDCAAATAEMAEQHYSYLNLQYHLGVIAAWEAQGCAGEIRRHLGYRFALEQVSFSEEVAPGGELQVSIQLTNSGFAAPYNERPVYVVLQSGDTRLTARLAAPDPRRWSSGEPVTLSARLRVPAGAPAGDYRLALWLPDDDADLRGDSRYAIRLANLDVWDGVTGDNVLATVRVDPAAPGAVDPGADDFVEIP